MNRLRGILFLAGGLALGLIIGGVVLFTLPRGAGASKRPDPPTTGVQLANFTLEGLNRKQVSLNDMQGKPLVLNFWATWCPPCRQEMPLFEKYSRLLDGKVTFIGVNYDEDAVTVQDFVSANRISFPIWLDLGGKVSDLYYIDTYPNTYFVDEKGVLRAQHIGQLSEDLLLRYLTTLGVTP